MDAAYKPILHDAWAERLLLDIRSRFGARLVPAKDVLADILRRRAVVRALAMNADQAPVSHGRAPSGSGSWARTRRSTSAPSRSPAPCVCRSSIW